MPKTRRRCGHSFKAQGPRLADGLVAGAAHDNGLFVLFSNGVGLDHGEVRTGSAMILDPYGKILVESDSLEDDMVLAELDASQLAIS